jgi:hypothetical protein
MRTPPSAAEWGPVGNMGSLGEDVTVADETDQGERIFCNRCGRNTWHDRKAAHQQMFRPEDYAEMMIDFAEADWEVWQCRGCEEVTFKETWMTSEDFDPDEGPDPSIRFYPPRTQNWIKPKEYRKLSTQLEDLYEEIVKTFNDGAYVLCAGGLRALLEGICVDQGVTSGPTSRGKNSSNLEGKINGLKNLPNVPAAIVDSLHGFRFLGNTALHQLSRPPAEDLAMAIEVIEDVMNTIYELDYKSARLYRRVKPADPKTVAKAGESAPAKRKKRVRST